ncbi:MAG TPA: redoxin domain-containing protein [Acidisarcina sp.]
MRLIAVLLFCSATAAVTQSAPPPAAQPAPTSSVASGPTDPKAQKTFAEAKNFLKHDQPVWALAGFRKADKQDGGHCRACEEEAVKAALVMNDFKAGIECSESLLSTAQTPNEKAAACYYRGAVFLHQGLAHKKDDAFSDADKAFRQAMEALPGFNAAYYGDGIALANLKQDDAARAQFQQFLAKASPSGIEAQRARRYSARPELARARMAPAFAFTTIDGKHVSLDDLAGKVVLIDFWATWCGPCREALPNVQKMAREFAGQPFVVLSISLDSDQQKWKDFVTKNEMTWLQARDGGFAGPLSRLFHVDAIPHTFTIDADGVLQDEHVGDANIEGRLKKLIALAAKSQPPLQAQVQAQERPPVSAP